jgi:hypothetical protein
LPSGTHAPEPAAVDLYASRDLSVVVVRPTWDALDALATHGRLQHVVTLIWGDDVR